MPQFERITLIIESLPGARAQVQVNIPTPTPGMRLETPAHALAIDALGWLGKQPAVAGFVYGGLHTASAITEHPTQQGLDARQWLQQHDFEALERFAETSEDDESYDIGKEAIQRLTHFGCLNSHGFGRYSITAFGSYVLDNWSLARELPFKMQSERDAEHRAALAAQAKQGEQANG
ncbi:MULTISPECIES: hypothetical protein [Comamonas]|uniref:hypothetical protein n=1 Tax=Comamonas TaxID=283 RepID=UPI0025803FD5|nr:MULTISPECIES: hypothetical protein [Comamonas]